MREGGGGRDRGREEGRGREGREGRREGGGGRDRGREGGRGREGMEVEAGIE